MQKTSSLGLIPSICSLTSAVLFSASLFLFASCDADEGPAVPANTIFTVKAGGSGADYATSVTFDSLGNTYVTGQFEGMATFGTTQITSTGAENMFLAKYDPAGNLTWLKQAGGDSHDEGRSVKVDAQGNVYVTGYFQGTAMFGATTLVSAGGMDMFFAKYSASGEVIWAKSAGGEGYDRGFALSLDASGNVYMIGQLSGLVFFSSSYPLYAGDNTIGVFLAKYNASGDLVWARKAGGVGYNEGNSLAVDAAGNVYLGGSFTESATFGTVSITSVGGLDLFLAKYDAAGMVVWAKRAGGAGNDISRGIAADALGNTYLTGYFEQTAAFGSTSLASSGESDLFLAKYDAAGEPVWARKAGGAGLDRSYAVSLDAAGNSFLTGNFKGTALFGTTSLTGSGQEESFLAKYSATGEAEWARKVGGTGSDGGYSTSIDASGTMCMGGYFQNNVMFGTTSLTSTGEYDIFLWKFKP